MFALAIALVAGPAAAQSAITDGDARAFVARQEAAWNAGRLAAWSTAFTPDATFTDQAYNGAKPPVPYGTSTLAEATQQARKASASGGVRETGRIFRITIAPDGRSAEVTSSVGVQNGARRLCASRVQTLELSGGRLRSRGQTDTYIRCRRR